MKNQLHIAIVHDYIKEFGGAESVLENLLDIFPDAQIYTTVYFPQFLGPHQNRLQKKFKNIHTSFFQKIPFAYKIISPLRIISPLAFKQFDFSEFDYIFTSATGAYFPNSLNKKAAKLICYCHTPPRYLYGLPTARKMSSLPVLKQLIGIVNNRLRILDKKYSQNVDQYIANSQTTADRIKKFYDRDSIIVNPPIETTHAPTNSKELLVKNKAKSSVLSAQHPRCTAEGREHFKTEHEQYFVSGGRLARAKRYDIAIQTCDLLGVKLKIFGRDFAGYEDELKKLSNSNVEFLGEIDEKSKFELLSKAKAFIFCSEHEDFGIAPVEAMACGCPVIAYRSGGVTETVVDGKTGYFYDNQTPESCSKAIQKLDKNQILRENCILHSQNFSKESFSDKIKKLLTL